jgi:hypothetical protein
MLKFLVFLAFLVAYGLWIWACTKAFGKLQSDAAEGHTFWVNQVLSFLTYGAFFGFIFILSGLWSWRLLVIFFLANELAILAAMLASFSLGAKPTETYLRATWLAIELNSNRPRLAKAVLWITVAIYLVYPIASGIVFFVHPLFTYAEQTWVVEGTVVYVIFGAYPLQLFSVIPLLTAKNLDEGTRQSIFINQLAGAVPTALFVAVGFWAFRVGASGPDFGVIGISQSLSVRAMILIFLFFALSILVPFLLGTQLARRQKLGFLKQRGTFLAELTGILESPTPAAYVTKLNALLTEIADYRNGVVSGDLGLQIKSEFDAGEAVPDSLKVMAVAMQKTGDLDPRFVFVKSLDQLQKELVEVAGDLQQRTADTVERAAAKWCKKYRARREELDKEVQGVTAGKALATVIISTAATTIVSGILSAVGKEASNVIAQHGIK